MSEFLRLCLPKSFNKTLTVNRIWVRFNLNRLWVQFNLSLRSEKPLIALWVRNLEIVFHGNTSSYVKAFTSPEILHFSNLQNMKDVIQMTNTIIVFSDFFIYSSKPSPSSLWFSRVSLTFVTCNYTSRAGLSSIVSKSLKTCRGLNRKYSLL